MRASFQALTVGFAIAFAAFTCGTAVADDTAPVVLKPVPGTRVILTCETNAIGLDFEPFKTSTGKLKLELSFKQPASQTGKTDETSPPDKTEPAPDARDLGTWTASVSPGTHEASLGVTVQKLCTQGCALRATPSGNMELWAPGPVMPSKLEDGQTVTLATLDVKSLELKASAMRSNQLSILEKGTCEISKP